MVQAGLSAHQAGDLALALSHYDQALRLAPNDAGLLGLKGMVLHQQGKNDQAKRLLDRALQINPSDPRLHNYQGQILGALGKLAMAQFEFSEALRLAPKYMEAWYNAGKAMLARRYTIEAIEMLNHALALSEGDEQILLALAEAYFLERRFNDAASCIKKITNPTSVSAIRVWISAINRRLGASDETEPSLAGQFEKKPQFEAWLKVGRLELYLGNIADAEHCFSQALRIDPDSPKPYIELTTLRKFRPEDQALLTHMHELLDSASEAEKRGLLFSLGKIYTDLGEYDKSFLYYQQANDLARRNIGYDGSEHEKIVSDIIAKFPGGLQTAAFSEAGACAPVFIVGTPRSGTTLVESIICTHSKVVSAGELDYWPVIWSKLSDVKSFGAVDVEKFRRIADDYMDLIRRRASGHMRITDKTPTNFQYLGLINFILPHAKIIHVRRHPVDACLSMFFQDFTYGHDYKWDLESLAHWYEQYVRVMDHWRRVLPPTVFCEVWYEDLIGAPEKIAREIMDFVGLDYEPAQLEYYKNDHAVFTASKWQARQPIYHSSKERWKHYEAHLGPLLSLFKYARA